MLALASLHPLPLRPSINCAGPSGYYRGIRTKIVQSVLAAALLFVAKVSGGGGGGGGQSGSFWYALPAPITLHPCC